MTTKTNAFRVTAWRGLFELLAAWGVAVTQPMLNLLGTAPDFFISFRLEPADVRIFVALLALPVPLAVWLIELSLVRLPRARSTVHYVAVGGFLTVFVAQLAKVTIGLDGVLYVAATLVVGLALASAYRWWSPLREWLTYLAVVPLLATTLFFVSSPAGRYARAVAAESSIEAATDVPIVFLMLDEFPVFSLLDGKGEIDKGRYPNFARLASMSSWYRNYSTTSEITHMAVPSVVSGVYPKRGLGSTFVDHPDTLFTLLANSHEMNVREPATKLCSPSICTTVFDETEVTGADWSGLFDGIRQLLQQRVDTTSENEMDLFTVQGATDTPTTTTTSTTVAPTTTVSAPDPNSSTTVPRYKSRDLGQAAREFILSQQTRSFNQWLDSLSDTAKPRLNYLHVFLPHQPWLFLPNGMSYKVSEPESQPDETAWEVRVKHQRHELQLRYVDSLIGKLLDRLAETGLLEKALLVVTGDHGVSFTPGYQRRFVTGDLANYPEIMHVPLFVRAPGQTVGKVVDDNVENVDVMPIIARDLGITIPWKTDGVLPENKSAAQQATKTLFFVVDPFTAPKRKVPSISVDRATFMEQTMTAGYLSLDPTGNQLQFLYDGVAGAELRFRSVSEFTVRNGSVSLLLDDGIKEQSPQVLVRGALSGRTSSNDVFVFARDGVILGVSPVLGEGNSRRLVSLLEPPKTPTPTTLAVYRVVDASTLEQVTLGE